MATTAGKHTDYYQVTAEDVPVMIPGQGGTQSPKVRADMVFFDTPHGGAVFSVGSITYPTGLLCDPPTAAITLNVMNRLLQA